ncbi:hypothetical protein CesoFtcFv8_002342 [Champsocephalus esox]|uniref:Uncharacterized protein n=1 Tax=Champsocephalus esox TaxID=159716 RepID=A0AAN8HEL8_9TELE|nr:hypothetical protein CesoFtcFv8_002342 [Champsocephalus esox]
MIPLYQLGAQCWSMRPTLVQTVGGGAASLCCGGRCSQSGRWRLFGGCRGNSGADTGGKNSKHKHSRPPNIHGYNNGINNTATVQG